MLNGSISSPEFPHYSLLFRETNNVCVCITLPIVNCLSSGKRENEYRLSRECARRALSRIDPALSSVIIVNNPDRSPVWPKGYVGSITHTDGYVSAVVALSSDVRAIGIDSEKIIAAEIISDIKDHVASKTEQALCIDILQEQLFYTLLFSAKESVFKALYPTVKHIFDFTDVRFLGFDAITGKFRVRLLTDLCEEFQEGTEIEGGFEINGGYVNTSVIMLNDKMVPRCIPLKV
ncbi:MAG: 4'-phosphopantetheinyl transferase superfamily protein [Elusimicrobiota bacterium]|nr:4'-phosphopantetheinyl transferase superfamily protein [Elusimicrobiota bacterium]